MQRNRLKSYTLVAIQFLCLIALALTGPLVARTPLFLVMELGALLLGVWALLTIHWRDLTVVPDPRRGARLVRHGPYRWIRHPMYATLLLGGLALVLEAPSPLRWGIWLLLLVNLLFKLHYEEGLLAAHFPDYSDYMQNSKRLIPFVY
jgi:protein-S-isoprenylcysteine O-methyltransferase Ste14